MSAQYKESFTKMHPFLHGISLVGAIGAAYWWISIPALEFYSLQVFAVSCLIYFVLKILDFKKIWHIMPTETSLEMVVATFAIMLLIGSTGNLASPLYALSYIHLFLLVFSSGYRTSLIVTGVIMLFHIGIHPNLSFEVLGQVMSLPIIMFFYLFAKSQYEEVIRERGVIARDEQTLAELEKQTVDLEQFLSDFMVAKLLHLRSLAQEDDIDKEALLDKIGMLEIEIEKILSRRQIQHREKEQLSLET